MKVTILSAMQAFLAGTETKADITRVKKYVEKRAARIQARKIKKLATVFAALTKAEKEAILGVK